MRIFASSGPEVSDEELFFDFEKLFLDLVYKKRNRVFWLSSVGLVIIYSCRPICTEKFLKLICKGLYSLYKLQELMRMQKKGLPQSKWQTRSTTTLVIYRTRPTTLHATSIYQTASPHPYNFSAPLKKILCNKIPCHHIDLMLTKSKIPKRTNIWSLS